jgi:hypothetical protein
LQNIEKNGIRAEEPLLIEFDKDPLVRLLKTIAREKDENDYLYISRLQDEVPKVYNNNFLSGSLIITDYYLDILRALGLLYRTDFKVYHTEEPTYLRVKAIADLYNNDPKSTIKTIENLQKKYDLESTDSYYILIAAYFASNQKALAYATLSEIELLFKDQDAKFLSGVQLIQDLKLNTVSDHFIYKLKGKLVDFRLKNFDQFLESL